MLKLKKGQCPACPPSAHAQPLINGMCTNHYWGALKNKSSRRFLNSRQAAISEDPEFPTMRSWYLHHINTSNWICDNCNCAIPNFSNEAKYSAQAHILPKEHFQSIKLHPLNRLHLGNFYGCDCHTRWDYLLARNELEKMPVALALALQRFETLKHYIAPSEMKHLPKPFFERL